MDARKALGFIGTVTSVFSYPQKDRINEAMAVLFRLIEKDEKYRWHDLRKNPKDLPERDGEYYVYQYVYFLTSPDPNSERCEPAYCIDEFKNGKFMNQFDGGELIAWREIEVFKEEE